MSDLHDIPTHVLLAEIAKRKNAERVADALLGQERIYVPGSKQPRITKSFVKMHDGSVVAYNMGNIDFIEKVDIRLGRPEIKMRSVDGNTRSWKFSREDDRDKAFDRLSESLI